MYPSLPTIGKVLEKEEEENTKRNLPVTLTMPPYAERQGDLDYMAKESNLIKKYHDQWRQDNGYHYELGKMISKVKAETKWRDIFIIDESQKRLRRERQHERNYE